MDRGANLESVVFTLMLVRIRLYAEMGCDEISQETGRCAVCAPHDGHSGGVR